MKDTTIMSRVSCQYSHYQALTPPIVVSLLIVRLFSQQVNFNWNNQFGRFSLQTQGLGSVMSFGF